MRGIRRRVSDVAGEDQPLAPGTAGAALVRVTAMDHGGDAVKSILEETLIGLIMDRGRHLAFGIRDHAVGRDDHIALDTVRGWHGDFRNSRGSRATTARR